MLVFDDGNFLFLLPHDVALQDGKQHVSAQHILPQIAGHVVVSLLWRIACAAHFACTIAALVERHEECFLTLQFGGHGRLIQVATEVGKDAVVEME